MATLLSKYVDQLGAGFVARQIGLTTAGLAAALKRDPKAFVEIADDGTVAAYSVRPIGAVAKAKAKAESAAA